MDSDSYQGTASTLRRRSAARPHDPSDLTPADSSRAGSLRRSISRLETSEASNQARRLQLQLGDPFAIGHLVDPPSTSRLGRSMSSSSLAPVTSAPATLSGRPDSGLSPSRSDSSSNSVFTFNHHLGTGLDATRSHHNHSPPSATAREPSLSLHRSRFQSSDLGEQHPPTASTSSQLYAHSHADRTIANLPLRHVQVQVPRLELPAHSLTSFKRSFEEATPGLSLAFSPASEPSSESSPLSASADAARSSLSPSPFHLSPSTSSQSAEVSQRPYEEMSSSLGEFATEPSPSSSSDVATPESSHQDTQSVSLVLDSEDDMSVSHGTSSALSPNLSLSHSPPPAQTNTRIKRRRSGLHRQSPYSLSGFSSSNRSPAPVEREEPSRSLDLVSSQADPPVRVSTGHPTTFAPWQPPSLPSIQDGEVQTPSSEDSGSLSSLSTNLSRYISGHLSHHAHGSPSITPSSPALPSVSTRRGQDTEHNFSLGVLPQFSYDLASSLNDIATSSTASATSPASSSTPGNSEESSSTHQRRSRAARDYLNVDAGSAPRRPHLQRNATAVTPPEESPLNSPEEDRTTRNANVAPRAALGQGDSAPSGRNEIPPVRILNADLATPRVTEPSVGGISFRVRMPRRSASSSRLHRASLNPRTLQRPREEVNAPTVQSTTHWDPSQEVQFAEDFSDRIEQSRSMSSHVESLRASQRAARTSNVLADSDDDTGFTISTRSPASTLSAAPPPSAVAASMLPLRWSRTTSSRSISPRPPSRDTLQAAPRLWGEMEPTSSSDRSAPISSTPAASASLRRLLSSAVPAHPSAPVTAPSRPASSPAATAAAAAAAPAASSSSSTSFMGTRRRPGSLGLGTMRGPTRLHNEAWLRSQGIDFYDSLGGRESSNTDSGSTAGRAGVPASTRAPAANPAPRPGLLDFMAIDDGPVNNAERPAGHRYDIWRQGVSWADYPVDFDDSPISTSPRLDDIRPVSPFTMAADAPSDEESLHSSTRRIRATAAADERDWSVWPHHRQRQSVTGASAQSTEPQVTADAVHSRLAEIGASLSQTAGNVNDEFEGVRRRLNSIRRLLEVLEDDPRIPPEPAGEVLHVAEAALDEMSGLDEDADADHETSESPSIAGMPRDPPISTPYRTLARPSSANGELRLRSFLPPRSVSRHNPPTANLSTAGHVLPNSSATAPLLQPLNEIYAEVEAEFAGRDRLSTASRGLSGTHLRPPTSRSSRTSRRRIPWLDDPMHGPYSTSQPSDAGSVTSSTASDAATVGTNATIQEMDTAPPSRRRLSSPELSLASILDDWPGGTLRSYLTGLANEEAGVEEEEDGGGSDVEIMEPDLLDSGAQRPPNAPPRLHRAPQARLWRWTGSPDGETVRDTVSASANDEQVPLPPFFFRHIHAQWRLRPDNAGIASEAANYMNDDELDTSYEGLSALAERIGNASGCGASRAMLDAGLERYTYTTNLNASEAETRCGICLEEYVENDTCSKTKTCGHGLHTRCLETWLSIRTTCPICRQRVV